MTGQEIINKIKDTGISVRQFADLEFESPEGVGPCEEVEKVGGEGKGDHWYKVLLFTDHNVYIKIVAFYSSYEGRSFDGWHDATEVKPTEKTITVYE